MAGAEKAGGSAGRTPVASLAKGLTVLEALASASPKGSLPELMRATGFDRATVHRILRSFIDAGYVERGGRGEYSVSSRGYLLGAHLTSAHALARAAEPELRALRDRINETVNLAVLSGSDIVYLIRLEVSRVLSLNIDVGSRLPAYAASLGRAILAFLPESEAINILQQSDRHPMTPHTKVSIEDLLAVFEQARRRGYVLTNQEFDVGLCSMAHPIFTKGGRPVAAVNIAISVARMGPVEMVRRYREPLQQATHRISRALGWDGVPSPEWTETRSKKSRTTTRTAP